MSSDRDEELMVGKSFDKRELIDRLLIMGASLDDNDHNDIFYEELYDSLISKPDNRQKIRNWLEHNRNDKRLNRKRRRDERKDDIQYSNEERKTNNLDHKEINDNKDRKFQDFQERNLNLKTFMNKIDDNLNQYKTKFKNQVESIKSSAAKINSNNLNSHQNNNLVSYENEFDDLPLINSSDDSDENNSNINNNFRQEIKSEQLNRKPIVVIKKVNLNKGINEVMSNNLNEVCNLTGSTRNVQEVIKKLNSKKSLIDLSKKPLSSSNTPHISSKNLVKINTNNNTQLSVIRSHNSTKKMLTNSILKHTGSIRNHVVVDIRPVVTSQFESEKLNLESKDTKIDNSENFKLKDYKTSIISLGLIAALSAGSYYLIENYCLNRDFTCLDRFNDLLNSKPEITFKAIGIIIIIIVVVYIIKKLSDRKRTNEIAERDYQLVKEILKNNYESEDYPLGLFELNLIKDLALSNKIAEEEYKRNIWSKIKKLRVKRKEIDENEILIQGQAQKVWNLTANEEYSNI